MSKNYTQYFQEAFSKLRLLEKDFDISKEALDGIQKWKEDDNTDNLSSLEDVETVEIIDPEAWGVDELQDDYVGKVILQCVSCQSTIVKDASEVYEDEETGNLCPDTECPVCHSQLGYTALGKVEHYDPAEEEGDEEEKLDFPEEPEEEEVEEEEEDIVEESLHNKIRRRNLGEAKKDVCPDCGKNPCVCEGKDCADCDESCSKDEGLTESKKLTKSENDTITIKVDAYLDNPEEDINVIKTKFNIDAQYNEDEHYDNLTLTGTKEALIDYLTSDYYGFEEEDIEEFYPELLDEGKDCADCDESCSKDEGLNEALNNISLDTDDQHLDISADETGRISVVSEPTGAPAEDIPDTMVPGEDSIVPLDNNDKENIEANISPDEQEDIIDNAEAPEGGEAPAEEMPAEEEVPEEEATEEGEDMDFELEAESFNYLGNTFAKKLYENVASYEMTGSKHAGNDFIVEGNIKFNSGNEKPTSFVFTEGYETKTGRLVLEGANKTFFPTKAFKLRGKLVEGKLVCESLRYNYSINKLNESTGKQEPVAVRGIVRGK